jgi:hypothetical protein
MFELMVLLWRNRLFRRRFRARLAQSMQPDLQQLLEESPSSQEQPTVVRLTLYPSQGKRFLQLLEHSQVRAGGIQGLLATINRSQDLSEGHVGLQLQIAQLDAVATRKIQQIIRESRKE